MKKGLYANIHAKRKRGGKCVRKVLKVHQLTANFKAAMTVKKKIMAKIKERMVKPLWRF